MKTFGRVLLLLLLFVLAALSVPLVRYNSAPVLLQFGLFDLRGLPLGAAVAGALWGGLLLGGVIGWLRAAVASWRLRRLRREHTLVLRSARPYSAGRTHHPIPRAPQRPTEASQRPAEPPQRPAEPPESPSPVSADVEALLRGDASPAPAAAPSSADEIDAGGGELFPPGGLRPGEAGE